MTNVDKIVNRFLGWKLPKDFAPDGGISFKRESDYEHPVFGRSVYEPVGTHLFTTDQAKAMFEYCLQGLAEPVKQEPVKQEPVADESPRFETEDHDLTTLLELTVDIYSGICNHDTAVWWHETLGKVEAKLTPVDAKAIRAEALEEAIKIVDNVLGRQNAVSAAIRGLK